MLAATIKTAFKVFLRRKFFTAASLFGIGFALTILLVVTALVEHVFGPRAPEVNQARTLVVFQAMLQGENNTIIGQAGWKLLRDTLPNLPNVETSSIFSSANEVVTYQGEQRVGFWLKRTDGAFWDAMRFRFLEGGPYTAEDDANGRLLAVINESTRRKLFGGEHAVGKTFSLEDRTFRVSGVVPDIAFLRMAPFSDVWVPIGTAKDDSYKRQVVGGFMAVIVARSRADFAAIEAEFHRRVKAEPLPDPVMFNRLECEAGTLFDGAVRSFGGGDQGAQQFAIVLSFVGFLFVALPIVNLVNLSVSRILERAPEIGVRKAFGATSRMLVVQFVSENVLLTLIGGTLALLSTRGILELLNRSQLVPHAQFGLNSRIFFWGLVVTLAFGVLSGAWPAWRMSRLHPVDALKGGL